MYRLLLVAVLAAAAARGPALNAEETEKLPPAATRTVDFVSDIQPLFKKNCFSCHGAEQQEGGLRLDLKKRAIEGGDSGVEIVAGKSAESRLVRVIAGTDEDLGQMPPEGKGKPLSPEEIGLVRAWIDQGAKWPEDAQLAAAESQHWSLKAVASTTLPKVREAEWLQQPLDAFVLARQEMEKVHHAPPAERTTLLRRLSLDLIGLPPTPEEVEAFLADAGPDAVERLVDRLLVSPHFGERWGRHWLDLARYADSDGYEKDRPRPFAFRYRDWVIRALNADMPYDQFTIEQIAGDMLPGAALEQRVAAGMHRNTLHNTEGGTDPEEDRVKKTVDRTNTLGAVWLGLTVGCAQCHSHKYDPLTQREYYSLYAFFNNIEEKDIENPTAAQEAALAAAKKAHDDKLVELETAVKTYVAEKLPAAQATWEKSLAGLTGEQFTEKKIPAEVAAALAKPADERTAAESRQITRHYRTLDPELVKLDKAVKDQKAKPPQLPPEAKAQSVAELAKARETHIHLRGDFLSPGEAVATGTPAFLPVAKARGEQADRLDLAQWLVDPANPLPARVAVNRVWHQFFGRGIVPTLDDFGKQGEQPSHPELLDWLASEFMSGRKSKVESRKSGEGSLANSDLRPSTFDEMPQWSIKRLIRSIVLSASYQQSSAPRRELVERDPENVLVARQTRRRVEAEVIRDLALVASGQLAPRIGGPSVRPPQPTEYATLTYANSAKWIESPGADRYRRGLYTFFQRTSPYPMLMTFDTPDSNECAARRQTSNTPLQALTIWNDPAFFESAQALGRRIVAEVPAESDERETARLRSERAFLLCVARRPSSAEQSDVFALYESSRQLAGQDEAAARQLVGEPLPTSDSVAEVAAWVSVGRTLLNLDEFITRE
jgi:mono/diheme cytochrome c family protein